MNLDPKLVVAGLFLIFVIGFLLISLLSAFYLKFIAKKNLKKHKFWLAVAIVSLAWFVATILSVMFASSAGMLVFAGVSMVAIFVPNYLLMDQTLKLQGKHKTFYCLALSGIINPIWYFMLG